MKVNHFLKMVTVVHKKQETQCKGNQSEGWVAVHHKCGTLLHGHSLQSSTVIYEWSLRQDIEDLSVLVVYYTKNGEKMLSK